MLSKFIAGANRTMFAQTRSFSAWSAMTAAPADPILGVNEAFKADTRKDKVLLGLGAYRDNDGKPFLIYGQKSS